MKKYEALGKQIIDLVGGEKNIKSLSHCVTRLRFKLKNEEVANKVALEKINDEHPIIIEIDAKQRYSSWDEALSAIAQPLIDMSIISSLYIKAIQSNIETYGSYFCLREGFAMPHARPEDGALGTGMSLLVLDEPVLLNEHKIYVILLLASESATSHLYLLSQISEIFGDDETFEKIKSARTIEEIIKIFKKGEII